MSAPITSPVAAAVPDGGPEARQGTREQINLALFSGGSGTQSITAALMKHPQISLKILINAYDDGHSTGRLRRFIPGMLGPSDVRKNINRLMPTGERCQRALRSISDYRLEVGIARDRALRFIDAFLQADQSRMPAAIAREFENLSVAQSKRLCSFLDSFLRYYEEQEPLGRTFDFTDCALGNLLFAGCYLQEGRDFNRTIRAFSIFYEVPGGVLLNITEGENLFLVAEKENGAVLLSEADIVAAQDTSKIAELFLLDEETYWKRVEAGAAEPAAGWHDLFREAHCVPRLNPEAAEALAQADVIVYGPGTQHSSLFPSYMTEGVAEVIAANKRADKIFVGNIHRDFDIQQDDANDLARKLLYTLSRGNQVKVNWLDVVSHFFVQQSNNSLSEAKYVPFDETHFAFPLETVKARDWESQEGKHSGGYVVDELQQIVQAKIDVELQRLHHMVSIVVPVLNEEKTIEGVLKSLIALDFQSFGLTKEIVVVDGGSGDRSAELARGFAPVRVFEVEKRLGRGAALRQGIEKARGNLVVFFPSDNEYRPEDLYPIVGSLVQSKARAVFGTRAIKCTDLSAVLMKVYENKRALYLTSKYGGILLSVLTLLLYNRYVTDVLTSVKAFDARLLRSLELKSNGIDLETELVAKISRKREYMFEIPVDYNPRSRSAGKKITAFDGIKAVFALFRYRGSST